MRRARRALHRSAMLTTQQRKRELQTHGRDHAKTRAAMDRRQRVSWLALAQKAGATARLLDARSDVRSRTIRPSSSQPRARDRAATRWHGHHVRAACRLQLQERVCAGFVAAATWRKATGRDMNLFALHDGLNTNIWRDTIWHNVLLVCRSRETALRCLNATLKRGPSHKVPCCHPEPQSFDKLHGAQ